MTDLKLADQRIVWVDVESDGIDAYQGKKLLQVASIVTDGNLDEIGDGFMAKVYHSEAEVERMKAETVPFVLDMHTVTGLWDTLTSEGQALETIEEELLAYFRKQGVKANESRLGGNSITLDRNFLTVNLPGVIDFLHYRNYDMTSVGGFFELYRPDVPQFDKSSKTHDALDDIRLSVAEAQHYRRQLQALGVSNFR